MFQRGEKRLGCLLKPRVDPGGSNFSQRDEHETPIVHPGMRQNELRCFKDQVIVTQQVQVDDTRSPVNPLPRSAERLFGFLEVEKKLLRGKPCLDLGDSVEVHCLQRTAHRFSFVQARDLDEFRFRKLRKPLYGPPEVRLSITQIGS